MYNFLPQGFPFTKIFLLPNFGIVSNALTNAPSTSGGQTCCCKEIKF